MVGAEFWDHNDHGEAVGSTSERNQPPVGLLYDLANGSSWFAAPPGHYHPMPLDVNNSGTAVGWMMRLRPFNSICLVRERDGRFVILNTDRLASHELKGVNDVGMAVGWTWGLDSARPAAWYGSGPLLDLRFRIVRPVPPEWNLRHANGVNRTGSIVVNGQKHGLERTMVLTPRPVPVSGYRP
jgi:hypothetical protein